MGRKFSKALRDRRLSGLRRHYSQLAIDAALCGDRMWYTDCCEEAKRILALRDVPYDPILAEFALWNKEASGIV